MDKQKSLIAFIDVLATKESAQVTSRDFEFLIKEFNKVICSQARKLKNEDKIKLFGNCAFIEFNSGLSTAIKFLQAVRYSLFCNQVYFKCALSYGQLDTGGFNPFCSVPEKSLSDVESIVDANYFGIDSIKVFTFHEKFKGVGFYVAPEIRSKSPSFFVDSGFFTDSSLSRFSNSLDIKFGLVLDAIFYRDDSITLQRKNAKEAANLVEKYDEDEGFVNTILKSVLISHAKKPEYSRYYISSLVSAIRSSNFSKLEYDEEHKVWSTYPAIFKRLFIDELHFKHYRSIPSLNMPFFCMVDVILKSKKQSVKDALLKKIVERKALVEKVKTVPESLLSERAKHLILSGYAKNSI